MALPAPAEVAAPDRRPAGGPLFRATDGAAAACADGRKKGSKRGPELVTRELWRDTQVSGYGHGSEGGAGGWPGLRQVLLVRTMRRLAYGHDVERAPEDHYYLTSLPKERHTPDELLALIRGHWLIENELHHVKDRTMGEDAQLHRTGASAGARLRSIAVGLLRDVEGRSVPDKQARLRASPRKAIRLLHHKRRPRKLL